MRILCTLLVTLFVLAVVPGQEKPSAPVPTAEQQAEWMVVQRNVADAQKALDLAMTQRLVVLYKIRSELSAQESKWDASVDKDGRLTFNAKPQKETKP